MAIFITRFCGDCTLVPCACNIAMEIGFGYETVSSTLDVTGLFPWANTVYLDMSVGPEATTKSEFFVYANTVLVYSSGCLSFGTYTDSVSIPSATTSIEIVGRNIACGGGGTVGGGTFRLDCLA